MGLSHEEHITSRPSNQLVGTYSMCMHHCPTLGSREENRGGHGWVHQVEQKAGGGGGGEGKGY